MNGALSRFRFMAYVVGVGLLVLVVAMLFKYLGDTPGMIKVVGPVHGFLYAIYLVLSVDLGIKARWSIKGTVLVLLAGTIPFLSFYAERKVVERVREGVPL
jgi:integral membrane protein